MYDTSRVSWEVKLEVTTKNIPRLMREGFRWTPANIGPEKGHLRPFDSVHDTKDKGWEHNRRYFLVDQAEAPQCTAWMIVYARDIQVLAQFRVQDLSPDQVSSAVARNERKELIYMYSHWDSGANFNATYNDTLEGWWPWPKRAPEAAIESKRGIISQVGMEI
ncbi:hypothetical protein QBC33DRAFT_515236 [Phialemonium atrogriseum]|uniref:Uncharacterized protein n=1 Tax=Phialemonium atrogriseum TaxID=1093897 RepID=A0AAJ0C0X4_9PEZI|nr:uncharacterized protein QBC33DRAFT_515236 [Phialemonium atrogriseum]KAK1767058.1 hypothetical protein QBC33DRAFT_515236 [Phialemonium atrogriseum]